MRIRHACIGLSLALLAAVATAQPPGKKGPKPPSKEEAQANAQPPKIKPGAKNLIPNGDFEEGDLSPKGWQTIDGLSTFWVKDKDPAHGKVLKFDTDILQSQAYEWWPKIAPAIVLRHFIFTFEDSSFECVASTCEFAGVFATADIARSEAFMRVR